MLVLECIPVGLDIEAIDHGIVVFGAFLQPVLVVEPIPVLVP